MKSLNLEKIKNIDYHTILDVLITHLKLIVITLSIVIIIAFGLFLYKDFYLTIISAHEIVILESEVSATAINIDKLNAIEQKHNQKQSLILRDWSGLNNLFYESGNPTVVIPIQDKINNDDIKVVDFLEEENVQPVTSF